jgi:hypothetical protein
MESTSPCNSLIVYSLKWRCCTLVWRTSLLTKTSLTLLEEINCLLDCQLCRASLFSDGWGPPLSLEVSLLEVGKLFCLEDSTPPAHTVVWNYVCFTLGMGEKHCRKISQTPSAGIFCLSSMNNAEMTIVSDRKGAFFAVFPAFRF